MKRITALLAIFTVTLLVSCSTLPTPHQEETIPCNWEVYFSPHGGCTEAIVKELNQAKSTVLVQDCTFTSAPIAKSLVDAHRRNVKLEVILDKSERSDQYSSATFFSNNGIPVKIDAAHAIAHNKVMVIDGETVITGSFNKLMGKPRGILIPTEEPEKIGLYDDSVAVRESFWKALFRPKAAPLPKGVTTGNNS
jgi:hypothetical protein